MWQSALDPARLRRRAALLASLRSFFADLDVCEVEVPVLGARTVTDPYLAAISCRVAGRDFYLQTSPEFFMKRLLAGGCGAIYYLGKALRADEAGRRHNLEFTLLEWYRPGFDDRQLRAELLQLLTSLAPAENATQIPYQTLFEQRVGLDPHAASAAQLRARAHATLDVDFDSDDRNIWLDLLFSHLIEPTLQDPTLVFDYPASQCALAKVVVDSGGRPVAKRFELFWRGMELANGYWELTDARIQRRRFSADLAHRQSLGAYQPQVDDKFLAALDSGMPECAGVALGVDRLFMCLEGLASIDQAMPFSMNRL